MAKPRTNGWSKLSNRQSPYDLSKSQDLSSQQNIRVGSLACRNQVPRTRLEKAFHDDCFVDMVLVPFSGHRSFSPLACKVAANVCREAYDPDPWHLLRLPVPRRMVKEGNAVDSTFKRSDLPDQRGHGCSEGGLLPGKPAECREVARGSVLSPGERERLVPFKTRSNRSYNGRSAERWPLKPTCTGLSTGWVPLTCPDSSRGGGQSLASADS